MIVRLRHIRVAHWTGFLIVIFGLFLGSGFVHAQSSPSYELQPATTPGGGTKSASPNYESTMTIGAPASSVLTSPNYELQIGFPATLGEDTAITPPTIPPIEPVPPRTTPEIIVDVIDKTTQRIIEALPEPVRRVLKRVNTVVRDTVQTLRENENIVDAINAVIEPALTTSVVVGALAAATSTAAFSFQLSNLLYVLFRFGYFWLVPLTIAKRRTPWGVAFDSVTGKPIRGAIVRIFAREFDKLKETQVTDSQGRFGFLVDVGEYYVHVAKPGFVFPSKFLLTGALSRYPNVYRGNVLSIKEKREGALAINAPLDPETVELPHGHLLRIRFFNVLAYFLDRLNVPLLIGGTTLSWVVLIIQPKPLNYAILGVYAVLILLKLFSRSWVRRSWGQVTNEQTKRSIDLALVRVFSTKGALTATRVTNRDGQFTVIVSPGEYYIVVTKPGYGVYRSEPRTIRREGDVLRLDVRLKPQITVPKAPAPVTETPITTLPPAGNTPTAPPATPAGESTPPG